jgi:hypothetical protein
MEDVYWRTIRKMNELIAWRKSTDAKAGAVTTIDRVNQCDFGAPFAPLAPTVKNL